jgi:hypothetical protein
VREGEPVAAGIQETQFVEDANAVRRGEKKLGGKPEQRMRSSPMTKAPTMPSSSKRARKRTPISPSATISISRKELEIAADCSLYTVAPSVM